MKVYIVVGYYYSDTYFDKVYIDKEKAKNRVEYLSNLPDDYDWGKTEKIAKKFDVPSSYLDLNVFKIIERKIADYKEGD